MKLVIMHDSAPDDLPGHIGVVRNVESMPLTAVFNAIWSLIMSRAARADNESLTDKQHNGSNDK